MHGHIFGVEKNGVSGVGAGSQKMGSHSIFSASIESLMTQGLCHAFWARETF